MGDFWPTFVEHMTAERMKPNTVLLYTGMAQRRLLPLLGQLPLHRVGELDVQRLKASMSDQAPSHVNSALTVLVQLLRLAHAHHPAVAVPAVRRVCSVAANDRVRVYTRDQAAALVEVLAGHGERLAALLLALDAGLRRGEVHGLRWCDVDLEAGELVVRHSLCLGELLTPKSGKSRRVALTQRLAAALGELGRGSEWVLPRSRRPRANGRRANAPMDLEHVLACAARAAGVPNLRPHALRHTFATFLLAAGAALPSVSKMLGHSSVALTAAVYCHHLPGQDRVAVAQLEAFVAAATAGTLVSLAERRARSRS